MGGGAHLRVVRAMLRRSSRNASGSALLSSTPSFSSACADTERPHNERGDGARDLKGCVWLDTCYIVVSRSVRSARRVGGAAGAAAGARRRAAKRAGTATGRTDGG